MPDSCELTCQHRRWKSENDDHFSGDEDESHEPYGCFGDPDDAEDVLMELKSDWPKEANHLRRFILASAKRFGIPNSHRDDAAQDALLEILTDLGRDQFDLLLESIGASDRIVEAFKDSDRGKIAARAIKRSLARFQFPDATFTDIGMYDESPHGS